MGKVTFETREHDLTEVKSLGVKIGSISKTDYGYRVKGSYFEIEVKTLELAKSVFLTNKQAKLWE